VHHGTHTKEGAASGEGCTREEPPHNTGEEIAIAGGRARTGDEVAWPREWTVREAGVEPGWREASIGPGRWIRVGEQGTAPGRREASAKSGAQGPSRAADDD
jgi:hypothetical protein